MLRNTPLGLRLTKECLRHAIDAGSLDEVIAMEDRNQVIAARLRATSAKACSRSSRSAPHDSATPESRAPLLAERARQHVDRAEEARAAAGRQLAVESREPLELGIDGDGEPIDGHATGERRSLGVVGQREKIHVLDEALHVVGEDPSGRSP